MKIKDIVPKPSDALSAMIKGLKKHSKRKKFEVNMSDFGGYDHEDKICYGCAATCTVQEIAGVSFTKREHIEWLSERLETTGLDETEESLQQFEFAIDSARKGDMRRLLTYYGYHKMDYKSFLDVPVFMETHNWESEIPKMKQVIQAFKVIGL